MSFNIEEKIKKSIEKSIKNGMFFTQSEVFCCKLCDGPIPSIVAQAWGKVIPGYFMKEKHNCHEENTERMAKQIF